MEKKSPRNNIRQAHGARINKSLNTNSQHSIIEPPDGRKLRSGSKGKPPGSHDENLRHVDVPQLYQVDATSPGSHGSGVTGKREGAATHSPGPKTKVELARTSKDPVITAAAKPQQHPKGEEAKSGQAGKKVEDRKSQRC